MTLAEMKPGESATIETIDTDNTGAVRLMVLGLVEGAQVIMGNAAIGGDPLEVSVYGAAVSVRRQQAERFQISNLSVNE